MNWWKFMVCMLFGYLGVHKFMEKKIGMGFLYLFTLGLFGVGWIVDTIRYLVIAIKGIKNKNTAALIGSVLLLVLCRAAMDSSQEVNDISAADASLTSNAAQTAVAPTMENISTIEVDPTVTILPTMIPTAVPTKTIVPTATAVLTVQPTNEPTPDPVEDEEEDYIVNRNSKIFHETYCGSVKKMKEANKLYFHGTREEAIERGYNPCKNCRP